ncbi:hypothetical protein Hanom_Chr07g00601881 [Helianthus anomalus]
MLKAYGGEGAHRIIRLLVWDIMLVLMTNQWVMDIYYLLLKSRLKTLVWCNQAHSISPL